MNHRRLAGVLLSFQLILMGVPTALAHETPSPTPSTSATPLSELEQYKLDLELFRIYSLEFKKIANRFTTAVNRANNLFEAAMRTARNDRARTAIMARRDSSIEIAVEIRDIAITELGEAPDEPTKPLKPIAAAKTKKNKTSSPSPTPSP